MPFPTHIIFDLDDTIVDYSSPAEKAWRDLYPVYARKTGVPIERLQQAVEEKRRWYWSDLDRFREGRLDIEQARRAIVRAGFENLGLKADPLADEMADAFSRERETGIQPFDGALDALETLLSAGAAMAMLTNGEARLQRAKIERFGLERFFRAILIESETGVGKPDPRAHRAALASLGAEPETAWMVGDNLEFDVRPAKALGLRAAWIREPAGKAENPADVTLPSIRLLVEFWKTRG